MEAGTRSRSRNVATDLERYLLAQQAPPSAAPTSAYHCLYLLFSVMLFLLTDDHWG